VSFYVGLDLGQAADFTALAVLEAVSAEEVERGLHLRHLERYPLRTPYTAVAEGVVALVEKLRDLTLLRDEPDLLVDNTGVGRAVTDVLREKGLRFKAVTLTGGSQVTRGDAGEYRVPKADVVDALVVPFQAGTLKVARELELWPTLRTELLNFRLKINPTTAHASYEHWRESDHDDLVLAAALAAWGAQRFPNASSPDVRSLAALSRPSYWSGVGGSSLAGQSWRV
jgi:hypothetical protein